MDRSDNDSPSVLSNIRKVRQVWGRLRKLLWREGAELTVSEKFYGAVVQAVILFGVETWVLTDTIIQQLEGAHVSSMRQVKHKQSMRKRDGSWRQVTAEEVLQGAGT